MATWDQILVERVRYLINDIDSDDYTWLDADIEKFLAISATYVQTDLKQWLSTIGGPYSIHTELSGPDMITPDPVATSEDFSSLIVAKASCMLITSETKKAGITGGWKIVDDKSTIDGTQSLLHQIKMRDSYCKDYTDAIEAFKMGNRMIGRAILSPYASPNSGRY